MKCAEVRQTLWPADELRIGDELVEAALLHAERCATCRDFLEQDRQIAELIRQSVPRASAPRELRERLFTVLARERAGLGRVPHRVRVSGGRRWMGLASMALVAFAAGGTTYLMSRPPRQPLSAADAFAHDYLRRVVEQESMQGTEDEIAIFFAKELGIALQPPSIPGMQVERAIICLLGGRRGGVVEYSGEGKRLSFYLIPIGDDPVTEPEDLEVDAVGDNMNVTTTISESGLSVATWRDGRHHHALVGDLDVVELRVLADRYYCPVRS